MQVWFLGEHLVEASALRYRAGWVGRGGEVQ
jgi:hypothetical protein